MPTKITITVAGQTLIGTLNDSAAAGDFAALLPLTLTLTDFHGIEKTADLPRRLTTTGSPAGTAARRGDLTYYAPWGNLAIFYRDFGHADGLVTLGRLDDDIAPMTASTGPFEAVIAGADR